jgi:superfamily II DNA or RNA helicase
MSVFSDTSVNLSELRDCQRDACFAARDHYVKNDAERHTLLQLPTGTGKSALIAALPFYVPCERVLVLVPNVGLVNQIKEDLDSVDHPNSNAYKKYGLLTDEQIASSDIFVLPLTKKVNRTDIQGHQIVVANYQKFQDIEKWFGTGKDLIDLLIIDEAHHQAANTYQELIKFFEKAKVIGLTATPFRSDGKAVDGKNIYTYHFRQAVEKGYIRNIRMNNVSPREVTLSFTEAGSSKVYTLDQIAAMSETAWFSRGVALSQDCCNSIADLAVEKLRLLRADFPQTEHQIIAAAISIRHAREFVFPAFKRHDLKIGMVSSDPADAPRNDKVKSDLAQGKIDVVINVGMLGEGFNQPTLGVAAIFRPFKTLNPYVQFVGRVIRSNPPATHCYVVSHLGLNQVKRFQEFRLFDAEDKEFLQKLFETEGGTGSDGVFAPEPNGAQGEPGDVTADSSTEDTVKISHSGDLLDIGGTFVDEDKVQSQIDGFNQMTPEEKAEFLNSLGIPEGQISKIIPKKIKPIQKRLAAKTRLNEVSKSVTTDIQTAIGIKMKGRDLTRMTTNFVHIQRMVSNRIDKELGIGKGKRNDLTIEQLDAFENSGALDRIKQELTLYFKVKLDEQRVAKN